MRRFLAILVMLAALGFGPHPAAAVGSLPPLSEQSATIPSTRSWSMASSATTCCTSPPDSPPAAPFRWFWFSMAAERMPGACRASPALTPSPIAKVFVAAYPDGLNRSWNDGRGISPADDVAFVRAAIEDIERAHDVDPRRIYAAGISNGGFFSNKLACDLSDKIAAIASVAATMPEKLVAECKPSRPVPVMYMQGSKDPLVPIDGGEVGFRRGRGRGESVSLAEAARFLARAGSNCRDAFGRRPARPLR